MKRLVRASKVGRPLSTNQSTWRVVHMAITIYDPDIDVIESSISSIDTNDLFFSKMIDHLESADYLPYLSVPVMQQKFHSSYSNSEYYTFLKVDGSEKVKLVLDIRFADHPSPQYGKFSAHDRHIQFMNNGRIQDVSNDGFDTSNASVEFYDIVFQDNPTVEISIDGQIAYTVNDALKILDSKIALLP